MVKWKRFCLIVFKEENETKVRNVIKMQRAELGKLEKENKKHKQNI